MLAGNETTYENFAREHSLPMFRKQVGFLGVFFVKSGQERAVITLWRGENDVSRLDQSPSYKQTVDRITQARMLGGESSIEVFHADGFELAPAMLNMN